MKLFIRTSTKGVGPVRGPGAAGRIRGAARLGRAWRDGLGGKTGFSLLEVVLAISILTALALGTTLLLVPIARQARVSRETEVANAEAQKVLEVFHATPFNEIVDAYPQGTQIPIVELPAGNLAVDYADPTADPLFIQVTLTWDSPELGNMQRVFATVRTE